MISDDKVPFEEVAILCTVAGVVITLFLAW
jgi:hypothetical protein